MQQIKKTIFSAKLSAILLIGSVILLPLFFLPYVPVSIGSVKGIFFAVFVILSFVFWLVSMLIEGTLVLPKNKIVLFAGAILAVSFISAVFSKSYGNSLWGNGFSVGTVSMMISGVLALFLSSIYIHKARASKVLIGLFVTGTIVLIFSFVKIFLSGQALSFGGVLFGKTTNLIGSWYDLGLFAGLMLVMSLILSDFVLSDKKIKMAVSVMSIIPLGMLIVVHSVTAWILVGLTALLVFVYRLASRSIDGERIFPAKAFMVILVSLLFIIANPLIGSVVPSSLGVSVDSSEIRPSISATLSTAGHVLSRNPILGVGPNNFSNAWSLYKPHDINATKFWDVSFNAGFGFIPTFLITTGILGAIAWLLFLIAFIVQAFKMFSKKDEEHSHLAFAFALLSLYLIIAMIVSLPGILIVSLVFVFVGIFVNLTSNEEGFLTIAFLDDHRKSFFSILGIVVVIAGTFVVGFGFVKKFSGIASLGFAINSPNTELGIESAEKNIIKGVAMSGDDFAYKALAQFYLVRLNDLLSKTSSIQQTAIQPELQALLSKIESSAQSAIAYNPNNVSNWLSLANVYDTLVTIGVDKSYENAKNAYEHALTLDPHNPSIFVRLANLELKKNNVVGAQEYIQQALTEKPDYAEAYLLLATIAQKSGDSTKAIQYLQKALSIEPRNSVIAFNLGLALYSTAQYADSVGAFERSLAINPSVLNTRYYLALAYSKSGRSAEAIVQMSIVQGQVPNNTEVSSVLKKLQAGESIGSKSDSAGLPNEDSATQ